MKKKSRKNLWQFIYIGITIAVIVYLGISDNNFAKIQNSLATMNANYLWICLGLMAGFFVINGLSMKYIGTIVGEKGKFLSMLKYAVIGEYYSALTPFASGGQPIQVVYMKRDNMSIANATCILAIRYIAYNVAICMFCVIMFVFRGAELYQMYSGIFWLTVLGFVITSASVILVLMIVIRKSWVVNVGNFFINLLKKIRIIKNYEKIQEKFDATVEDFSAASDYIRHNKPKIALNCLLCAVMIFCNFSVSYFIYRSFGLTQHSWLDLLTMQAFLYVTVAFVPTPGGSGAAEGGFSLFFGKFFSEDYIFSAMLLWRVITYFLIIAVGALTVIGDEVLRMRRSKQHVEE